jgi:hypothetical protein
MVDYKKFDSIIDSDSDDDTELLTTPSARTMQQGNNSGSLFEKMKGMTKKGAEGRLKFEHEGNTIYEWYIYIYIYIRIYICIYMYTYMYM